MDGNATAFTTISRLAQVHGIFADDRNLDLILAKLAEHKGMLETNAKSTSAWLGTHREVHEQKLGDCEKVETQMNSERNSFENEKRQKEEELRKLEEAHENRMNQLRREKKELTSKAQFYHVQNIACWEKQAVNTTLEIAVVEEDIRVSGSTVVLFVLTNGVF